MKYIAFLILVSCTTFVFAKSTSLEFTEDNLKLVKQACLVGSDFDFFSEADGSITIKNINGNGKIRIRKKNVDTVDLPDSDKKEEFKEIRDCIRSYLIGKKDEELSRTCQYTKGQKAGLIEHFSMTIPIVPAPIGAVCQDGNGSSGYAIKD
jgi:hypothetical protein